MSKPMTAADAEVLAIEALAFIAGDAEVLARFLAVTGLGPETLRAAARDPGFLSAVLDHLASDESLLQSFAANHGLDPAAIAAARAKLSGLDAAPD
jgi:hypothetical protein